MSERSRAVLFRRLGEVVHDEEAVGEMLASIPHDTSELATKDLVRAELHAATNKIIVWNVGYATTLAAVVLAAVRLA